MAKTPAPYRARLIAWAAVGIALALTAWFALAAPYFNTSLRNSLGQGDYRLETTAQAPFTAQTLAGAPTAVFFGYAHCPDVCPTTLGDIAAWRSEMAGAADGLRVFFITVDPERDTLGMMRDYLSWTEGVTGVTGPRPEIDKVLRAFRIYARKVPGTGDSYTMDHTANVLLFDAQGHYVDKVSYQEPLGTVLPKLRALMGPAQG